MYFFQLIVFQQDNCFIYPKKQTKRNFDALASTNTNSHDKYLRMVVVTNLVDNKSVSVQIFCNDVLTNLHVAIKFVFNVSIRIRFQHI